MLYLDKKYIYNFYWSFLEVLDEADDKFGDVSLLLVRGFICLIVSGVCDCTRRMRVFCLLHAFHCWSPKSTLVYCLSKSVKVLAIKE